jgi:hypothetical protein
MQVKKKVLLVCVKYQAPYNTIFIPSVQIYFYLIHLIFTKFEFLLNLILNIEYRCAFYPFQIIYYPIIFMFII